MEEQANQGSQQRFIYLVAAISALGGLLFGFDTGVISGALLFINHTFSPSTVTQEIIVSVVVLGAFVGAISSGRLADRLGRRCLLIQVAILFIIGTLVSTLAINVFMLIIGRLILGTAIGIASYTTPLYISEIAPKHKRGKLVLINAIAIAGGETIAYFSDYLLSDTHSWRLMFAVGLVPALLLLLGMWKMPESPRWLLLQGFTEQARQVLKKIRLAAWVESEVQDIQQSLRLKKGTWRELFSKKIRPVLIVGLGLGVLQQFAGINTVMYYGPIIFKQVGFASIQSQILVTFAMGAVNTIFSCVAVLLVERCGRRRLLLGGNLLAALSLAIVGWTFYRGTQLPYGQWIACAAMVTYITGYCLSLGSLFWLIIAEIYPLSIRGLAMSFVAAMQWAANFLVAVTFLTILNTFGAADTFWFYSLVCVAAWIFCFYCVPETTGVSLETIEHNLEQGVPVRQLGQALDEEEQGSPAMPTF